MFAKREVTPERQHGLNLIIPQSACPPRLRVHGLQRSVLFSSVKEFRSIFFWSISRRPTVIRTYCAVNTCSMMSGESSEVWQAEVG